jgi:phage/plasmid-associated DNA primase
MSLEIYNENGFKFHPCKIDKSPQIKGFIPKDIGRKKYSKDNIEIPNRDWKESENQISIDQAETLQKTGHMIGAWIPEDIVIIDLDTHEGKADGVDSFKEIIKKLDININFSMSTTFVKTAGGGYHLLFYVGKDHGFKQGTLKIDGSEIGIDIKTNKGYVIASGSPGYLTINNDDPMIMPDRLKEWILDLQNKTNTVPSKKQDNPEYGNKKRITPKLLKSILNKLPIESFNSNDRWLEFIMSVISTAGDSVEIVEILDDWSSNDPNYSQDRSVRSRISSISSVGGITTGTFINLLREENLSPYLINQVVKIDSLTTSILSSEEKESDLPFKEPDYNYLVELPECSEFFTFQGNSSAKKILFEAFSGNIIYSKQEKETFYFDGNKWEVLRDMYSIVYTIMIRVAKVYYQNQEEGKENNDRLLKIINCVNDTTWKSKTITELNSMIREDVVSWDPTAIMETVTTTDGVIEFRDGKIIKRKGYRGEYRRSFVSYTTDEILNSKDPVYFKEFMKNSFPDDETLLMANQLVSLCISGSVEKRIFQLWEGEGSNGKSTLIDIILEILKGKSNTYNSNLLIPDKYARSGELTPDLEKFPGSYAAMATEVEQSAEFSLGTIKKLSGGDPILINPKFKSSREIEPTWQLILAVNDLPRFNSTDEAFIGRLRVLPFVMRFPRDDNEKQRFLAQGTLPEHIGISKPKNKLKADIFSEKAGVIRHLINIYVDLQKGGGKIFESELARDKKNVYIQDNDDFGKFINDVCIIEPNAFCTSNEITEAFKDYLGLKKASSKWVITSVKKHNRSIGTASREVIIKGEYNMDVKKRRRGLTGIRLKTQIELNITDLKADKGITDNIPF